MKITQMIQYVRELCYGPDPVKDPAVPVLVLTVPLPEAVVPVFKEFPPPQIEVVLEETPIPGKVVAKVRVKRPVVKRAVKKVPKKKVSK
jgi:hypothetical protein